MALIVETGEGLPNADSYISIEDADAYFASYPNDGWDSASADREFALRRATQELDLVYGGQFVGTPKTTDQALAFPRVGDEEIPTRLKRATSELAALLLADESFSATTVPDDEGVIERKSKVGELEETVKFGAAQSGNAALNKVRLMLGPLLYAASGGMAQVDVVRG